MVRTMNLNNLNMNAKIEELLSTLNKKEEEKEKNTVLWGAGNHRCSCSSSRYRICSLPLLHTRLSGGF